MSPHLQGQQSAVTTGGNTQGQDNSPMKDVHAAEPVFTRTGDNHAGATTTLVLQSCTGVGVGPPATTTRNDYRYYYYCCTDTSLSHTSV